MIRTTLDLIYKDTIQKRKEAQMSMDSFFDAIERLADLLYEDEIDKIEILVKAMVQQLKL
jgi:hypothetical protein